MGKAWEGIKFSGRLFFKPRTTFKGYKIVFVCFLELILMINLLTIIAGILLITIWPKLPEIILPIIIIPTFSISFFAIAVLAIEPRRKRAFLGWGMALPIFFWIMGSLVAFIVMPQASKVSFFAPGDIALDSKGALYVTCPGVERVFKFSPDGGLLLKFGHAPMFKIAIDDKDIIYVTNWLDGKIFKFDTVGKLIGELPLKSSLQYSPLVDDEGNIYILQWKMFKEFILDIFDPEGNLLKSIKLDAPETVKLPQDIVLGRGGSFYIADPLKGQILKFDFKGRIVKALGSKDPKDSRYFGRPWAIDVDDEENIYVALFLSREERDFLDPIKKLSLEGDIIKSFGKIPSYNRPYLFPFNDIVADNEGKIYVTDSGNFRIHKLDRDGNYILSIGPTNFWAKLITKMLTETVMSPRFSRSTQKYQDTP
jgi:sugar lactone lactonase YvrE